MSQVTPAVQAHANVNHFGMAALVEIHEHPTYSDTIRRHIQENLHIPQVTTKTCSLDSYTDLHACLESKTDPHSNYQVLFLKIHRRSIAVDIQDFVIVSLCRDLIECRKLQGLSTIVLVSGYRLEASEEAIFQRIVHGSMGVCKFMDVCLEVCVPPRLGPDAAIFAQGEVTHRDPSHLLNLPWYFHTEGWENMAFLDIDETLLAARNFLRTRWAGTNAGEFANEPFLGIHAFDQEAVAAISKLSRISKVKWVLSSTWRIGMTPGELKELGLMMGLPLIGRTQSTGNRDSEIAAAIEVFQPQGMIVTVDDEALSVPGTSHILANAKNGISWEKLEKLALHFGASIYGLTARKHAIPAPVYIEDPTDQLVSM